MRVLWINEAADFVGQRQSLGLHFEVVCEVVRRPPYNNALKLAARGCSLRMRRGGPSPSAS